MIKEKPAFALAGLAGSVRADHRVRPSRATARFVALWGSESDVHRGPVGLLHRDGDRPTCSTGSCMRGFTAVAPMRPGPSFS